MNYLLGCHGASAIAEGCNRSALGWCPNPREASVAQAPAPTIFLEAFLGS